MIKTSVENIFDKLKIPFKKVSGGKELMFRCIRPEHNDRHASACISVETGLWHCFSCQASGNLNRLVKIVSGETLDIKTVMTESENLLFKIKGLYKKSMDNMLEYENDVDFKIMYDSEKDNFIPALDNELSKEYLTKKRKLTRKTIIDFGLMFSINGKYENRVIIPYYSGKTIVGINSRYIGECDDSFRYRYMLNNKKFSDFLFNEKNLESNEYCILAEGPFDLMYLHQCGFKNVISTLNTRMSVGHLKKLMKFKKIIFCFDNDEETHAGDNAVLKHAEKILSVNKDKPIYKAILPVGKDPNECSKEDLDKAFKKLKRIKLI